MYTILNSEKTLNPVAKSQETKILNLTAKIKNHRVVSIICIFK